MKKKAFIVIGLGFGDEGKGLATDYIGCQTDNPLVIRFNGGQQAGHTVATRDGKRHVFSNFGSGTLRGIPTYWSNFCTFSPGSVLNEYNALTLLKVKPILYVDTLCPVTTHYDVLYNKILESMRGKSKHGSCGMGFGATIERNQLSPVKLFAQDLIFPEVLLLKIKAIKNYYSQKIKTETSFDFDQLNHDAEDLKFMESIQKLIQLKNNQVIQFVREKEIFSEKFNWQNYIFEGAQGILLDMDFGFFPHVTRSNTTSKNALTLINSNLQNRLSDIEIYYITRAYQTRHGEGPMTNENINLKLVSNENETNQYNQFQGKLRVSPLDINLLQYAMMCDDNFSYGIKKNLIITCCDQLEKEQIPYFQDNELKKTAFEAIPEILKTKFGKVLFSRSSCGAGLE